MATAFAAAAETAPDTSKEPQEADPFAAAAGEQGFGKLAAAAYGAQCCWQGGLSSVKLWRLSCRQAYSTPGPSIIFSD